MTALSVLFERFVKEKRYLHNVTLRTLDWYASAWAAFNRVVSATDPDAMKRSALMCAEYLQEALSRAKAWDQGRLRFAGKCDPSNLKRLMSG